MRLRDLDEEFVWHDEDLYDADSVEELKDNIEYLFELVYNNKKLPHKATEDLADMLKNYYGNISSEYINSY